MGATAETAIIMLSLKTIEIKKEMKKEAILELLSINVAQVLGRLLSKAAIKVFCSFSHT